MTDTNFINELATELKKLSGNRAVGEVWISVDGKIPAGGIPFDGRLLSKTTYSALWNYCKDIAVSYSDWLDAEWKYCNYSSTQFKVPKIDKYLKADGSIGVLEAGLPNITGSLLAGGKVGVEGAMFEGAFSQTGRGPSKTGGAQANETCNNQAIFDASRSNPIYGNSTTVTPETNKILIGVYAFNAIVDRGEADVSGILADHESRITANSNKPMPKAYITETWHSGSEWYRVWSDGFIEQGGRTGRMYDKESTTVSLPHGFRSTDYTVMVTQYEGVEGNYSNGLNTKNFTKTSFVITARTGGYVYWNYYTCGY